VIIIICIFTY